MVVFEVRLAVVEDFAGVVVVLDVGLAVDGRLGVVFGAAAAAALGAGRAAVLGRDVGFVGAFVAGAAAWRTDPLQKGNNKEA